MEIKDYILVHGTIINIKDNVDKDYIWFDISNDNYYKDKDGKIKNNPSFFSARINKKLKDKYILKTNIEVVIKGIPKGFLDKNGYRNNFIHVTDLDGIEMDKDMLDKIIDYDSDGVMLWHGKRCESTPLDDEDKKFLKEWNEFLDKLDKEDK